MTLPILTREAIEAGERLDATLAELSREHAEGRIGNTPVERVRKETK